MAGVQPVFAVSEALLVALAAHCDNLGFNYAILGGAACFALGSGRTTVDVDLVMDSGPTIGVDDVDTKIQRLVESDPTRFNHTLIDGIPLLTFDGYEIEIFDPTSWPSRPQYRHFLTNGGSIQHEIQAGTFLTIVAPPLLLREKLITYSERKHSKKTVTDADDITFLLGYCAQHEITVDLRGASDLDKTAKEGLAAYVADDSPGAKEAAQAADEFLLME